MTVAGLALSSDISPRAISWSSSSNGASSPEIPPLPRGAITEISGAISSGRTSLLHKILAEATAREEVCAVVDGPGMFDPHSAAEAGVELRRLLWVRCGGRLDFAIKATDLILHSGGFGVVALDLCEIENRDLNRIPLSYWYRFRNALENTPARLVVVCHAPLAKACTSLHLETQRAEVLWRGPLLHGIGFAAEIRKRRIALAG